MADVIKCKDCKHFQKWRSNPEVIEKYGQLYDCSLLILTCPSPDDYCSKAERYEEQVVRCGQCKYAEVADSEDGQDGYTCQFHRGSIWFSGSYCSWAERK